MSAAVVVGEQVVTEPKRRNRLPEFTRRDGQALMWLGEQYGARLDVLGVLLGRLGDGRAEVLSRSAVRNQVERWQRQGLVMTRRMLGETWVTPTRAGLERVELPFPVWGMPVTRLHHCHAINVVRLWWESQTQAQASPWISERRCYAERGKGPTWHIPDGKVVDQRSVERDGPTQFLAIEVELTHKGRKAYETEVFGICKQEQRA